MRIQVISITQKGAVKNMELCRKLKKGGYCCEGFMFSESLNFEDLNCDCPTAVKDGLKDWTKRAMADSDAVIFITACGIAIRSIAPFIQDKYKDPAVLVMDEHGKFVIPVLSGHVGGANRLARLIERLMGAIPVITTATDINKKFAIDEFAVKNQLFIVDRTLAKEISAAILREEKIRIYTTDSISGKKPEELQVEQIKEEAYLFYRSNRDRLEETDSLKAIIGIPDKTVSSEHFREKKILWLVPKTIYLGIGCRKGVLPENLEQFVNETLKKNCIMPEQIAAIASIDRKKTEKALVEFHKKYKILFRTYSEEELRKAEGSFTESEFVKKTVGIGNVCERAAVLASENGSLLFQKTAREGMTLAAAERKNGQSLLF